MTYLTIIVVVIIAYLIGSISSAIIVCKLIHLPDPRTQGSLNPGATNVLRIGGKKAAAITLLGDMLKGMIPVLLAIWLGFGPTVLAIVGFAAFIGHLFPIFFQFEGGKGVATSLGCILALSWPVGLCWLGTWLLVVGISRYVSIASMMASFLTPIYMWYFTHQSIFVVMTGIMGLIIIIRHHSNIAKLFAGQEKKIRIFRK